MQKNATEETIRTILIVLGRLVIDELPKTRVFPNIIMY